jgi:hypothetical protein
VDARVLLTAVQEWLAGSRLARSVVGPILCGRARRHLARLDRLPVAPAQARVLLDLVREAGGTPFGRDHDFRRIRRVEDFRRLVPLRRPADLGQTYGLPVAAPPRLLAAHRQGLATALALVQAARPSGRLCRGRILFVGDLEGRAACAGPAVLRPYVLAPRPDAGDDGLLRLARQAACLPVTCLVGAAARLLDFLACLRDLTGRDRALDVWPDLAAVVHHGAAGDAGRQLAEAVDGVPGRDPVLLLQTWFRPEGTAAVEDPRHGLPRLLPDHGVYLELVPAAEADRPDAVRHGLAEMEPGGVYEIALTSPAGWWACRTGLTVRVERRDPPLVRQVPPVAASAPRPAAPAPARTDRPRTPAAVQGPHPRSAGSPAALPGMPFHSLWSAPADRG